MKQAIGNFIVVSSALIIANSTLGYEAAYAIGYGALSIMAVLISGTFLWLWQQKATPLALGMAFSWAGAASVMGWWWIYNLTDRPPVMQDNGTLFFFLSAYFVGAALHFSVVQRSIGLRSWVSAAPIVGATGTAIVVYLAS